MKKKSLLPQKSNSMICNKGFSLLSFLVYLILFSTITFFICQVITSSVIPSLISLRKTQSLISLHIASDFFIRDIKAITDDHNAWKVAVPHEMIWQTKQVNDVEGSIGWRFSDNCLERREGLYDGVWKNAKTSIVAKNLTNVTFSPERDDNGIIGITLIMASQLIPEKPVLCYVCTKKRENHEK